MTREEREKLRGLIASEGTFPIAKAAQMLSDHCDQLEARCEKLEEFVRQVDEHTAEYAGVAGNGELYALVQALAQGKEKSDGI